MKVTPKLSPEQSTILRRYTHPSAPATAPVASRQAPSASRRPALAPAGDGVDGRASALVAQWQNVTSKVQPKLSAEQLATLARLRVDEGAGAPASRPTSPARARVEDTLARATRTVGDTARAVHTAAGAVLKAPHAGAKPSEVAEVGELLA